jgi:hypothetical protein
MNTVNEDPAILKREITGYLSQKGVKVQLIISTIEGDPSVDLVKSAFKNVDVAIMPASSHPGKCPRGSFLQLNNALRIIRGDWFTFASSNDRVYPGKLKSEVDCCLSYSKEVCYSAYNVEDATNRVIRYQPFHEYRYDRHLQGNFVSDCSLISRRLVDKYLPFRDDLNNYAYWDLWLRIYEGEGDVFVYNSLPTWGYVQHTNGMHILRQKSAEQIRQADADRQRMLSLHRKPLKVLNWCKDDYANFAYDNMKALRSVGVHCECVKSVEHVYNYPEQGEVLHIPDIKRKIAAADVIQFFFNMDIFQRVNPDLRGKKLIVYYASSDFRSNRHHYLSFFNPRVHKTVIALGEFANLGARNEVYVVGAIDTDKLQPSKRMPRRPCIAAHYPSRASVKGTPLINSIAETIKGLKYTVSTEKVDYDAQIKRVGACDIYIELFQPVLNGQKYGSFGISALEAAAMGKIVVTQNLSRKVYEDNYGECPFILCETEAQLRDELTRLAAMTPAEIRALQNKTREWVVTNHSYKATGMRILNHVL